jgi:hypothetical protein
VGQWVHLAGVYDGTQWLLYRDGVLVATSGPTMQGALQVTQTDWSIGSSGSGGDRFFQGQIAEVRIWNTGRSAASVISDMATTIAPDQAGLIAYYQFNETGGTTVLDATRNQNTGVLGGSNPANAPIRVAGIAPGSVLVFTPPNSDIYTVALTVTDANGMKGTTSHTIYALVPPTPTINGLPSGSSTEGTPVTLTATATDPSPAETAAGFNYVWSVSAGTGQQIVAGQNVSFNGSNPIALPNALIQQATSLNVTVTFQTTGSGVILGYQNQALGSTPTDFVPALYVGTDGYLRGELFDGIVSPIPYTVLTGTPRVSDGQVHTASLNWYGNNTVTLSLDGNQIGETKVTPQMLDMSYDMLGTGYTSSAWPATPGGYFPFTGTISSIVITSGLNSPLAGSVVLAGSSTNSQIAFTPPDTGPYSIILSSTDTFGNTGVQTSSFSPTELSPTLSAPSPQVATQGKYFFLTGSFSDAAGDGPWTITMDPGDGTGIVYGGAYQTGPTSFGFSTNGHKYVNAGMFNARLTITNADGFTLQATVQVSVSGFTVNDGSPQRSRVRSLTYTFARPTQIEPGTFKLLQNGKPTKVGLIVTPFSDGMTYVITFIGPGVAGGSVPDGKYTLITSHDKVRVLSGPPMTTDDVNTFFRLFGDVTGDGVVNAVDKALLALAQANPALSYATAFNYDGKPVISQSDIAQFDKRYTGPAILPAKLPGRNRKQPRPAFFRHTSAASRRLPATSVKSLEQTVKSMINRLPVLPGRKN